MSEHAALNGFCGVVTGAARGIGHAVAEAIVRAGGSVLLVDLDADGVTAAATSLGASAAGVAGDVARFADVEAACGACVERFGSLDFVVANAGIGDYSLMSGGDPERWRRLLEVNLLGAANTVRAALPLLERGGTGTVVLMASIAGREAWVGEPVYIASKWGVVGLGHTLRLECEPAGIRVTLIEPGMVDTPLVRSTPEGRAELASAPSLAEADVGRAVVFALSQPPGVAVTELTLRPLPRSGS